jgi:sodium-dependent dicarboxylate transporter 2/3/5
MSEMEAKIGNKYYVHLLITILLIFGADFMPALGPFSAFGMKIIILFAGIIYGYMTMGLTLPSFMALVSLGFTGYDSVPNVLKTAIGNSVVLYVFSVLMLAQLLADCGLTTKLINWMVTRKAAKGKPWMLSFLIMLAAYLGSFLVNMVPPCIILWSILFDLFDKVGYKKGDKWPSVMVFGVLFTSTVGAFVTPFQIGVVANYGMLTAASQGQLTLDFAPYFLWAFVCGTLICALWFVFAKYIIRPDVSLLENEDLFEEDHTPLTKTQKFIAAIFVLFIIGLFLPSFLPQGNLLKALLENLGNCGWGLVLLLIVLLVPVEGKLGFKFDSLFSRSVIWDIAMMMACIMTIAGLLADPSTGIPGVISKLVAPMINELGLIPFWLVLILLVLLLGNVTNTVAVSCIFIPVIYSVVGGTGFNMILFTGIVNFVGNICLLLPACSPNAAMMYGQKEWITTRYCVIYAVFTMIAVYLVMIAVGLPLGSVVFR